MNGAEEAGGANLTPDEKALVQKMKTDPKHVTAADTNIIMNLPPEQRNEMYREAVNGHNARYNNGAGTAPVSGSSSTPGPMAHTDNP